MFILCNFIFVSLLKVKHKKGFKYKADCLSIML